MKIDNRCVSGIMLVMVCLIVNLFGCSGGELTILASGPVPVYINREGALSGDRSLASDLLSKGQQVMVLECIDVKHYQVYKIKLASGMTGYINDGDYLLLRDGKKSAC